MQNLGVRKDLIRQIFAGLALLFVFFPLAVYASSDPGMLAKGEALFNKNCKACHGIKGSGTDKGPPLVHKIYHPNHHGDVSFHWAVEKGVKAHHWDFGNMPRIEGVKPEEVDLIIEYVRNLQREAGIY